MPNTIETAPPAPQGRSVRRHLGIFTAVLVTPILLFVGFLLWQFATAERSRLEREAAETARAIASALDRDIAGLIASLDVTATSAYLQSGDLDGFYDQLSELQRRQNITAVLTALDGQQLVNVRVPKGTPLPKTNLPWDQDAIRTARPYVTNLFTGVISNQQVFAVATGIQVRGELAYVLNFSFGTERLLAILNEAEIPAGYTASVVDRAGVIMARNVRHEEVVGRAATPDLRAAATGSAGSWSGTTFDGEAVFGTYARSQVSGYRAAVGVRYQQLNAPLWRSLSLFSALGAVILGLSILLGLIFGQRITVPIAALAERAGLLGRGEPIPPLATEILEANQVGAALTEAAEARRRREEELRDANDEIQRFAYIVSHDLRSPLVNIMGFTTELEELRSEAFRKLAELRGPDAGVAERQRDKELAQDFDEAIGFIKTSIGRMDRLINAILRLSREGRREFHPERIDMSATLAGIRKTLAHQAEQADATVDVSALPDIASDRLAVEQIFSNLVDNAIKYLRRGVPGRITVSGRREGPVARFEVKDNGRGIEERDRERVFELFRRSGVQDRPGEGIGLAHVRALVRRLGGTITLTSEPGQGSTFTVIFPRRWPGTEKRVA